MGALESGWRRAEEEEKKMERERIRVPPQPLVLRCFAAHFSLANGENMIFRRAGRLLLWRRGGENQTLGFLLHHHRIPLLSNSLGISLAEQAFSKSLDIPPLLYRLVKSPIIRGARLHSFSDSCSAESGLFSRQTRIIGMSLKNNAYKWMARYFFDSGANALQCHKNLAKVYPDCPSPETIRRWYAEFKTVPFMESVRKSTKSGRPSKIDDDLLKAEIEANPKLTSRDLAKKFQVHHSTVAEHLLKIHLLSAMNSTESGLIEDKVEPSSCDISASKS
uniref:HTH_48 domain-containing protein n=1 Tax=Bursaphelenchus xylophilus TaxID=6326 RepID=A0A1I7S5B0_BURXY